MRKLENGLSLARAYFLTKLSFTFFVYRHQIEMKSIINRIVLLTLIFSMDDVIKRCTCGNLLAYSSREKIWNIRKKSFFIAIKWRGNAADREIRSIHLNKYFRAFADNLIWDWRIVRGWHDWFKVKTNQIIVYNSSAIINSHCIGWNGMEKTTFTEAFTCIGLYLLRIAIN